MLHKGTHQCTYYCAPPVHATNLVLNRPLSEFSPGVLEDFMRAETPYLLAVKRFIPATEVVDVTAWMHQHPDGQDFVARPGVTYYPVVMVAEYEPCCCEECADAVSVA